MINVLGLGDNVVDKYMHIQKMYPGGNALNFSVYAKSMGIHSEYLGVFGDDEAAKHVYSVLRSLEIPRSHCRHYCGENGYAEVTIEEGDRIFVGSNKGGIAKDQPIMLSKLDIEYIRRFDIVHTSCFSYLDKELPKLSDLSSFISMDFSNHYSEEYLKRCSPYLDCVCLSCGDQEIEEVLKLMNDINNYGCKHIIIATRGSLGAVVMVDGKVYEQSPCLVKPLDTMGAGDSFITCFLVTYVEGMKGAVDFPKQSIEKGLVSVEMYQESLVKSALYKAAVYSANNCLKEGSFGYGIEF